MTRLRAAARRHHCGFGKTSFVLVCLSHEAVPRLGWGVALWLACAAADALAASLEAAGVTIAQRPQDGAFGRQFSFVDPDGYTLTVYGGAAGR